MLGAPRRLLLVLVMVTMVTPCLPAAIRQGEEVGVRVKRARDTVIDIDVATPSSLMRTSFNNTHVYQPRLNITINNRFERSPPSPAFMAGAAEVMLTTFTNSHVHQPTLNITINNFM